MSGQQERGHIGVLCQLVLAEFLHKLVVVLNFLLGCRDVEALNHGFEVDTVDK